MHKGTITMLGRIMAGSQVVIAHDDAGQALFVAYDPPTSMCLRSLCILPEGGLGHRKLSVCHRPRGQCRGHGGLRSTTRAWACCACSMTTSMLPGEL